MSTEIYYEIHPAIGIARLGPGEAFFLGPEPDCPDVAYFEEKEPVPRCRRTRPPEQYRESNRERLLKRQAARFRIFRCERDKFGALQRARELRSDEAQIEWTVQLANRKAAAPRFDPEERPGDRNKTYGRDDLIIDTGPVSVTEAVRPGNALLGKLKAADLDVCLGEAWAVEKDAHNHLYVLGGKGRSREWKKIKDRKWNFADNDGWCDDTSDGRIAAAIKLKCNGRLEDVPAERIVPAWLIVAPFDFAPELDSYITLYDVVGQAMVDLNLKGRPSSMMYPTATDDTAFNRDILPLLKRVRGYRWVNGGGMRAETQDRHARWNGDELLKELSDPANERGRQWRRAMFAHLPEPPSLPEHLKSKLPKRQVLMPRLFGHNPFEKKTEIQTGDAVLPLTWLQYAHFRNWASDAFVTHGAQREFLCDALTRVALEACSGGAFYPGMEAPRIMRGSTQDPAVPPVYHDFFPLRIDWRAVKPGEITAGLAVPWQSDFLECEMERGNAWWPVTRPDHVLVERPDHPVDSLADEMYVWREGIEKYCEMVDNWQQLGIVKRKAVTDAEVPTDRDQLTEFRRANFDESTAGGRTQYFYFAEDERVLPQHKKKSAGPEPTGH